MWLIVVSMQLWHVLKTAHLVKKRVTRNRALLFSTALGVSGFILLAVYANWLTAYLTLFALLGYAVVYTLFLKRATPQNIVIGGLAGAMPPLLGWVSETGVLAAEPWILVMIIFTWTPPHFLGISDSSPCGLCQGEYSYVTRDTWYRLHQDVFAVIHTIINPSVYVAFFNPYVRLRLSVLCAFTE